MSGDGDDDDADTAPGTIPHSEGSAKSRADHMALIFFEIIVEVKTSIRKKGYS